ncbi:MAG: CotH kinase family protein, partial [Planctomycetales bacterium]|nr:CotH kinase family protein [Planctomycetales bacterium]
MLESRLLLSGETAYISEFMASNSNTLLDRYREYSDWIEIYNPDDQVLSLEGWFLTDDADVINKWELPDIEIDPNSFAVVFASGNDRSTSREAHTNFRLSSDGEYLALVRPDLSIAHAYSPSYPAQFTDVSFGISFVDGQLQPGQQRYFPHATPGEANSAGVTQLPPTVEIQANSGYFDAPLSVTLASDRTGATIRYTVDGNIPDESSPIYQGPVTIDTTTVLRAVAFGDDAVPSEIATKTFIYLDDVLTQTGAGLPEEWGYFDDQGPPRPARAQANYGMDPDVVNDPDYSGRIKDDLRAVPTISLVVDPDDLWDFENGIYSNPEQKGDQWERLVSAEWMDESGVSQFNINAGIRIHGGWARRFTFNSKFSFRLHFRGQYGTDSLDFPLLGDAGQSEWQSLILRGGFNDSWQGGSATNTYLQDHWTAATQIEMGGHAPERRYAHLYLNGLYWGMYAVTERMDANWAATHQGGSPDEWDVVNTGGNLIDGEPRPWSDFTRLFGRGDVDYAAVKELLDVEAYADYMIVNQYVGNWDWPHNNWYASRRRVDGAKWHFHTWDAEAAFQNGIGENRVSNVQSAVGPAQVWLALIEVPEFRDMFAGRVYKHLFNDGLLTPDVNSDRLDRLAAGMDQAIVGESARWGDGRVDQTRTPLTREHWVRRIEAIKRSYFGNR